MNEEEREVIFQEEINGKTRIVGKETLFDSDLCDIRLLIERKMGNTWNEIGHAIVIVNENHLEAEIGDLSIGSRDGRYVLYDEHRTRPKNIERYANFRGMGIGTKVATIILQRLKKHGINRVYGFLSEADDQIKAKNFWLKLGFTMEKDRLVKKL